MAKRLSSVSSKPVTRATNPYSRAKIKAAEMGTIQNREYDMSTNLISRESKAAEIRRLIHNREQDLKDIQEKLWMKQRLDELNAQLILARHAEHKLKIENQSLRSQLSIAADSVRKDYSLRSHERPDGADILSPVLPSDTASYDTHQIIASNEQNISTNWIVTRPTQYLDGSQRIQSDESVVRSTPTDSNIHHKHRSRIESSQPFLSNVSPFSPLYGLRLETEGAQQMPSTEGVQQIPSTFQQNPYSLRDILSEAARHINIVRTMLEAAGNESL